MDISDIKIRKTITEGRLRAIVSITIEDTLAVQDFLWQCQAGKMKAEYSEILYILFHRVQDS